MSEDNAKGAGKMFSEDTVAVLLMALGSVSISSDQYKMMSALDGTKTASSFQHSCRSVLKKAKELKARVDNGEVFVPVSAGTSRGPCKRAVADDKAATPPTTPKKRKNTPKAKKGMAHGKGSDDGMDLGVVCKEEVKEEKLGGFDDDFV